MFITCFSYHANQRPKEQNEQTNYLTKATKNISSLAKVTKNNLYNTTNDG